MAIIKNPLTVISGSGGDDNLPKLLDGTITEVKGYNITELKDYALYNCAEITEVDLPHLIKAGNYALYNNISLEKFVCGNNVSLGQYALYNCQKLYDFDFANKNINSLGDYTFYCLGSDRANPSTNRLQVDMRKSNIEILPESCFLATSDHKVKYTDFKFNTKLKCIQNNVFQQNDNCEYWFESVTPPILKSTNIFTNNTNATRFIPYYSANAYKTATNWSNYVASMIAYLPAGTMEAGSVLPSVNKEGYLLTWYSDKTLTTPATTVSSATDIYYCTLGNNDGNTYYGIIYDEIQNCTITLSANGHNYSFGEAIPDGTVCTITATAETGYIPYLFTVNGNAASSGDTITVNSDLSIVAIYYDGVNVPISPILNDNSWAIIRKVCRDGNALTYWNLGDTKDVVMTDGYTYAVQLVDTTAGRYRLSSGIGSSNVVFQWVKCLATSRQMNSTNTNVGGFAECAMRTALNTTVYNQLPADLKAVISEVSVESGIGNSTTSGTTDSDNKLFLASEYEISGAKTYSIGTSEGSPQYGYWALHNRPEDRIKTRINSDSAQWWWLRSLRSGNSTSFCGVSYGGPPGYDLASYSCGVCPCFAI